MTDPVLDKPFIRAYAPADRDACLTVFDSNLPRYFAPYEREQFLDYLAKSGADYLVAEQAGRIVGGGGTDLRDGVGHLCWGMVARDLHRTSVGKALLRRRVEFLFQAGAREVAIDTSQHVAGFFARHGFRTSEILPDGLERGLDLVKMTLRREDWVAPGGAAGVPATGG